MTARWQIEQLRVGKPLPFGPNGEPSAINKRPVAGRVMLSAAGFEGDEQGDTRHHGGAEKAAHLFPRDHYAFWRTELPTVASRFVSGGFGENLVVAGMTEAEVCIGDLFRLGEATVQLSQGRQPCWKLNLRFGVRDMARRVQQSGRTGWYFRVLSPGIVAQGSELRLIERLNPDWPLTRLNDVLYRKTLDRAALRAIAQIEGLSRSWRSLAQRRLARGAVEAWAPRLVGPTGHREG